MKFVKKMLATLVACAMAMTLLTGCGGSGSVLKGVNEILKGQGSSIVLEQSRDLAKLADEVADLEEDHKSGRIDDAAYRQGMAALAEQYGDNFATFKTSSTTDAARSADLARAVSSSGKVFTEAAYTTVNLPESSYVLLVCR